MHRLDRLLSLILFLQSRRFATAASMAERFGLSQRTIYRDMKALAEAGVPVLAEAGVGFSLMRGYLLPPVNFSEEEAFALATGGALLERTAESSFSGHVSSSLRKIRAVLPPERREQLTRLIRGMGSAAFAPPPARQPDIALIQKALVRRRLLRLLYQGHGKTEAEERVVEPLGLLYYLGRWRLIAWCRLRQGLREFRIDRMLEAQMLGERFAARGDFDPAAYVRENMPRPKLRAVVRVHPDAVDRVRREWWLGLDEDRFPAQDGEAVLCLFAVDWDHLASWLLSFGTMATVIEPAELRERVAALAEAVARRYRTDPPAA